MKRTQLYLPEDLYLRLFQEARRQLRAMVVLAREFLQAGVEREQKKGKRGPRFSLRWRRRESGCASAA